MTAMDAKELFEISMETMMRTETSNITDFNPRIEHAILGMADEAGEFVSAMKRCKYYNKPLDILNLEEEAGDMIWYLNLLIHEIAVLRNLPVLDIYKDIVLANRAKLETRYPDGFSNDDANDRDLGKEREAMEDVVDKK